MSAAVASPTWRSRVLLRPGVPVRVDHVAVGRPRCSASAATTSSWRFISLKMINEDTTADWYTTSTRPGTCAGLYGLRDRRPAAPATGDERRRRRGTRRSARDPRRQARRRSYAADPEAFLREVLDRRRPRPSTGRPRARRVARRVHPRRHRAGVQPHRPDVGTPILTFAPGTEARGAASSGRSSRRRRVATRRCGCGTRSRRCRAAAVAELKRSNARSARLHLSRVGP